MGAATVWFAWGDLDAIRNRIRAHQSAGADYVCIQAARQIPTRFLCRNHLGPITTALENVFKLAVVEAP
jgi:hypothetical protein